jgi:hypothetical protein
MKISGACGRLLCCLKYEHPLYVDFARKAPAVGERVTTDEGDGVVVGHQVPAESVLVRVSASGAVTSCALAKICGSRQAFESKPAPPPVHEVPADEPDEPSADTGPVEDRSDSAAEGARRRGRSRGRRRRAR